MLDRYLEEEEFDPDAPSYEELMDIDEKYAEFALKQEEWEDYDRQ